jgi:hypothetical protein
MGALVAASLLGVASGAAVAGKNIDPVDTVTSVVSSVGDQTVPSVVSTVTGAVGDAVSGSSGGGSGAGREAGLRQAPQIKTRFDRLPRRIELLLERIEVGRNLRANIRRLERALETAPSVLRARVLRLGRAEMRRLERGGLTRVEQGRLRRIRLAVGALTQPGGARTNSSPGSRLPDQVGDPAAGVPSRGGVASSSNGSGSRPFTGSAAPSSSSSKAGEPSGEDRDVGGFGSRLDLPPPWESQIQFSIYVVLLALLIIGLAILLLAAVSPDAVPARRLRRFVRASRIDLAVTGVATLTAVALVLLLL